MMKLSPTKTAVGLYKTLNTTPGFNNSDQGCGARGWVMHRMQTLRASPQHEVVTVQVAFLAIMSTSADWSRRRTPLSDDWLYLPTVYPADSFITMRARAP